LARLHRNYTEKFGFFLGYKPNFFLILAYTYLNEKGKRLLGGGMEEERLSPAEFLYDALNEHFSRTKEWLDCGGYQAGLVPGNEDFICFNKRGRPSKDSCADGKIFQQHGLKFHVGLPEFDRDMYTQGWNILIEVLFRNSVENFKVIRSNCRMSDESGQEGKDITIYADSEPKRTAEEWKAVLEEITNKLAAAKIIPGYRPPGTEKKPEKPVNGSNYITYRYYDEFAKKSVWPKRDPCQKINVVSQYPQLDIPAINKQKTQETVVNLTNNM